MSSVITGKSGLSSILKNYIGGEREKAKQVAINKVRFELPKLQNLNEIVESVCEKENYQLLSDFVAFLKEIELTDEELLKILKDGRTVCTRLSPKFTNLVEAILSQSWLKRSPEVIQAYFDFTVDLLVAHNKYAQFLLPKLVSLWIPGDAEETSWLQGTPTAEKRAELEHVHRLIERIITVIPMTFGMILENIDSKFPYFKRGAHVIAGYVHNTLWFIEYQPSFTESVMQILLEKLVILDVNAPRGEIEDAEAEDEEEEEDEGWEGDDSGEIENNEEEIGYEKEKTDDNAPMSHAIAHTLDMCMMKMLIFLEKQRSGALVNHYFKVMRQNFDNVLLPCHNTHHVQFLIFYYCSFKQAYAESFLASLLAKVRDPNTSVVIRQTSVGYIASFIARAKYLSLSTLKYYIRELSNWAHQYVERSDEFSSNGSLKANIVFFSVCQAIFYVIAFRSRILTCDREGLLFLQSLRLSALVTCKFNPLRYCLPAVATAFAGVTRTHQLAYCHAVLERNARRKLATVYTNGTETAEETLDIFFPFDPYLLKSSNCFIRNIYLQYQPSEAEEQHNSSAEVPIVPKSRKRCESELFDTEDMDDFLLAEKRRRTAMTYQKEHQYSYEL